MTTWVDYIPWVSIQVSMVPRDLHIAALRQSAIVLCEKSHCWKEWLEPWGVSTGERDITVEHPDSARIHMLSNAYFDDDQDGGLRIASPKELEALDQLWRTVNVGEPEAVAMVSPDVAALYPHPDADGDLVVEAILKPSEGSLEGPDFLYEEHRETICKGAVAWLLGLRRRPWSDQAAARDLNMEFDMACRSAGGVAGKGRTRTPRRSSFENR